MSKTATIRTRIEPSLKSEVEDILAHLGLTASETVHLLYRQIKLQRGLPFDVRIPNELTARALNASKAGRRSQPVKVSPVNAFSHSLARMQTIPCRRRGICQATRIGP